MRVNRLAKTAHYWAMNELLNLSVISAKAGIRGPITTSGIPGKVALDSRFRGNDGYLAQGSWANHSRIIKLKPSILVAEGTE